MGRQVAVAAGPLAIPVDFVGGLGMRNEDAVLGRRPGCRQDVDMAAVPGESRIRRMPLRAPRTVGFDRLPLRIVKVRLSPARIVSHMKLPRAYDRNRAFAYPWNDQGRRRIRGCLRGGIRGRLLAG